MRRLLPAAAAVIAAGCGYVGDPLPPLANVPARVTDLSAVQRGNRIIARFTLPRMTTEGMALKEPLKLDLRIGPVPEPFRDDFWAAGSVPAPNGSIQDGTAAYEIPTAMWTGMDAVLGVRSVGSNGKWSGWSNLVGVPVVPPPDTPMSVQAEATAEGVRLSWQARGMDFRIFRRSDTQDFTPIADVPQSPYVDSAAEFGKSYTYRLQTIVKLSNNREAESELSPEVSLIPLDKFPPATPSGLRATPTSSSVELTWERNTEMDLGGYRVYRAAGTGPFEKIADNSTLPTYSDRMVEHGTTYRYAISALDQSGNESPRSAPMEVTVE